MTTNGQPIPADVTASVDIAIGIGEATRWFADAANLPDWTGFFRSVTVAGPDGKHTADSVMGTITTWTETVEHGEHVGVDICSLIRDRTERAALRLWPTGPDGTSVELTVTLLVATPQTVHEQLQRITTELGRARHILEAAR